MATNQGLLNAEMTIGRELAAPGSTGTSFETELRDLIWQRARLAFIIGLGISASLSVLHRLILGTTPILEVEHLGIIKNLYHLHALSFLAGLLIIHLFKGGACFLQMTTFGVIVLNLLVAVFTHNFYAPSEAPFLSISLLLFVHAAFIPCKTIYQGSLALMALVLAASMPVLVYWRFPEAQAFWAGKGGLPAFKTFLIWAVTGAAILGIVSIMITHTLYSLRKTAFHAKRLGNYLIVKELGMGGMGQVFLARHALMCRPTAVKVLNTLTGDHQSALARFEREVQLSSTLTHPNTITIFDFGRTEGNTFYYAMEFLQGLDLQAFVERFGPLPPRRTLYVALQICGSLAEAHERNIIHRDIKPSNIFLTHRGGLFDFVKVLDFGLAKKVEADSSVGVTNPGMMFGTPRFIAPEAVLGSERISRRTDIYNLGGVIYWMVTGHPPFESTSSMELLIDHVKSIPKSPSEVSELDIPRELDNLIMKCLEKSPDKRYQSVSDLEEALQAVVIGEPWTPAKAKEWWDLHAPELTSLPACEDSGMAKAEQQQETEVLVRQEPA